MKKAKKINSHKTNSMISTDNEMTKLIILILIVAVIFAIFYVVTLFVTKKNDNSNQLDDNKITEVVIDYSKILVGSILSQKSSEYYVLICFKDDNYVDLYKSYLENMYKVKEDSVPFYYVDANNTLNNEYISDTSNLNVTDVRKFRFSQTTLLRIKDGKVISTYEGHDNITGKLGRMTK